MRRLPALLVIALPIAAALIAGCGTVVPDFQAGAYLPGWVTVPLGQMYNPVFFIDRAYAIRGDTDVPLQPVSHGCVRIHMDIAQFFHTMVVPGVPVYAATDASRELVQDAKGEST